MLNLIVGTMDPKQLQIYQSMPPHQRIRVACQLHDFALHRLRLHLKSRMKDADERAIQKEILKRFLGESAGIFQ